MHEHFDQMRIWVVAIAKVLSINLQKKNGTEQNSNAKSAAEAYKNPLDLWRENGQMQGVYDGMDVTRSSHIILNKWHTFQFMSSETDHLLLNAYFRGLHATMRTTVWWIHVCHLLHSTWMRCNLCDDVSVCKISILIKCANVYVCFIGFSISVCFAIIFFSMQKRLFVYSFILCNLIMRNGIVLLLVLLLLPRNH